MKDVRELKVGSEYRLKEDCECLEKGFVLIWYERAFCIVDESSLIPFMRINEKNFSEFLRIIEEIPFSYSSGNIFQVTDTSGCYFKKGDIVVFSNKDENTNLYRFHKIGELSRQLLFPYQVKYIASSIIEYSQIQKEPSFSTLMEEAEKINSKYRTISPLEEFSLDKKPKNSEEEFFELCKKVKDPISYNIPLYID